MKDDEFDRLVALIAVPHAMAAAFDAQSVVRLMHADGYEVTAADVARALARWCDEHADIAPSSPLDDGTSSVTRRHEADPIHPSSEADP